MTRTFAFLTHPTNHAQLIRWWPMSKMLPERVRPAVAGFMARDRVLDLSCATKDTPLTGHLIRIPLLPCSFRPRHDQWARERIMKAAYLAKGLGCRLLGVGGCASRHAEYAEAIARRTGIPVTNGNSFTAWSVMESVYRAAHASALPLEGATVAVIGAGSAVGRLCAYQCTYYVKRIVLWDSAPAGLEQQKADLEAIGGPKIEIAPGALSAVKESDICIMLTDWTDSGIAIHDFPSQSVVCDLTLCDLAYQQEKMRPDLTFVTAGLVKVPPECAFTMPCERGAPGVCTAALAETMVLALEERYVSYSLGDRINADKVEEIADLVLRHGFQVWIPQLTS